MLRCKVLKNPYQKNLPLFVKKEMNIAVATVAVCAVRKEPVNSSEITSQLLFGELAEILSVQGKFSHVRCLHDDYTGWCYANQLTPIEQSVHKLEAIRTGDWCSKVIFNEIPMMVPFGSNLQLFQEHKATIGNNKAIFEGKVWNSNSALSNDAIIQQLANIYLGTAYAWGGRSVFGIDCSGLVQMMYLFLGYNLHRDAWQQALQGEPIGFLEEVKCGDLAFFDNEEGKIIHVGLLLNSAQIIHAAEKVRFDRIDNQGIVHTDSGKRTHQLRTIKRIFP